MTEFTIRTVNAITDWGKVGKGGADSHTLRCDDENDYIVKFVNLQNKVAINEFISAIIALDLELPTPDRVLINISKELIEDSESLSEQLILLNPHPGSSLVLKETEDFDKFTDGKLDGMKLTNNESLYGIVVFDNWLFNTDRNNKGNNLITFLPRNKIRLVMIDFGHCLGGNNWDVKSLKQMIDNENPIQNFSYIEKLLTDKSKFEQWIEKIENFKNERIDAIIDLIPSTWGIVEEEKTILSDFLKTRKNIVRTIITKKWG